MKPTGWYENNMKKGSQTKRGILEQAVQIFSVRGFEGMSMDELMHATGLTKGGIYNHFDSKDDLALQTFDYSLQVMRERFRKQLEGKRTTRTRLLAVIELFQSLLEDPLFAGGCVLLTTAVEADDTHPALRERARKALDDWRATIIRTMTRGMELGDVRPDTDVESAASVIVAALEGAIMMSKTYGDNVHMERTVRHLSAYIETFLQENPHG
jgi:AcrR family transcriptional regulator